MLEKFMENYKLLIIIPVIITILSLATVAFNGVEEGIELKGGSIAILKMNEPVSSMTLENQIRDSLNNLGINVQEVTVVSNHNLDVTVQMGTEINSTTFTSAIGNTAEVVSYNSIGPVLGQEAMNQIYWAIGFAFLFMSITIFLIFREPVPSITVVMAAVIDMIVAMAGMSLFNVPLSIASVGALLMVIGYSIDTNLLLTTRVLKRREGTVVERAEGALKTGITMSITAISSMVVLYVVTIVLIPEASVLSDIAAVLFFGLIGDILTTWFMNLGILRWYVEARQ